MFLTHPRTKLTHGCTMLDQCGAASTPNDAGVIALTFFQDAFDWSTGVTTEKPKVVKVRAGQMLQFFVKFHFSTRLTEVADF